MARRRHGRLGAPNGGKSRGRRRGHRDASVSVPVAPRPTAREPNHHQEDEDGATGSCPRCLLNLPDETLLVIMEYGGASAIGRLAQTCQRLAALGRDDTLWRHLCLSIPDGPSSVWDGAPHPRRGWRWIYRANAVCLWLVAKSEPVGWAYIEYGCDTRYAGEWSHGQPHGYGRGISDHGLFVRTIQGRWKDGVPHGFCIEHINGQESGRGNYHDGKLHGMGKTTYSPGWTYEGHSRHGARHGVGTERYPDGSLYRGQFQWNERHGNGVLTLRDGTALRGSWAHDAFVVESVDALWSLVGSATDALQAADADQEFWLCRRYILPVFLP